MSRDLNRELLELLGFEGEELEKFMPDWLICRERCYLDDARIAYAVDTYIPQNWEIRYLGVRKFLGAQVRALAEMVQTPELKAKGVKIIYGILPAISTFYYAAKNAGGDNVFIGFPDLLMVEVLNGVFDAADPYYYEAEKQGFSYGARHCPLNKMRFAAYTTGTIAAPDLIWSWGFNCDEGPKTDELIQRLTGKQWNYHVSRAPHDSHFYEREDLMEHRVKFMCEQLKLGIKEVEKVIGVPITDEHMAKANADFGRMGFKIGMLNQIVGKANPAVLSGETLAFIQGICNGPFNCGFGYFEEAIDILTKELKAAVKAGEGIMPKDSARVGWYCATMVLPWMGKLFRDNGVVCVYNGALSMGKLQMAPSNYPDDPWMSAAESWCRMSMCMNVKSEAMALIEKMEDADLDGVLVGLYDFDRWMGAQQKITAKIIQEETGIPTYYIEGDYWDDREYNMESLKTKIESISQIINTRKAMKLLQKGE